MTEIDLTPITRLEYDIDAILNDHAVAEPITRIELILADIVAGNTTTVVPVTRIETFLAIISGADYPVPEPVTRIETFLAIIAGENYETPEAVTRLEGLLAEWVEKGAGIWKTVSGSLIHITDALASPMQKCEVTLEPIQDLHGQDAPYPAGGGKNKCLPYTERTSHGGINYTATANGVKVNGTATVASYSWSNAYNTYATALIKLPTGTYTFSISALPTDNQATSYCVFMGQTENGAAITDIVLSGTTLSKTATFSEPVGIYYGFYVANGEQVNADCKIMIESGPTKTDFSPYSNICPITGWTGCEVPRTGKNLFPFPYYESRTSIVNVDVTTNADGSITLDGTASGTFYYNFGSVGMNEIFLKAGTYTLSGGDANSSHFRIVAVRNGSYYMATGSGGHVSFTLAEDATLYFYGTCPSGTVLDNETFYPQLELGSTATDYEPYQGTTLSVTFPSASMGKFEVVSGDLKPFKEYNPYNGETLVGEWMSDRDKYVAGTTPTIGAQVVDLGAFDTSVSLTPTPVDTLQGENNILADCGDVEVTYKAQA